MNSEILFGILLVTHTMPNSPVVSVGLPWMCRNKTLNLAIQDLANNIAISMVSSPHLTAINLTMVNITTPHNVYEYNIRNLIISYSLAIAFAVAIGVGFFALYENGVAHSTSFSAIMTATQSSDRALLSEGSSIGVMQKELKATKLRFGVVEESNRDDGEGQPQEQDEVKPRHVSFGFPQTVGTLKKGRQVY